MNNEEQVTISQVTDADTFVLQDGRRIRLFGVDAPETYPNVQPYGKDATEYASVLLGKSTLDGIRDVKTYINVMDKDIYGRTVARVLYGPEKIDLGLELLKAGLVWAYRKYLKKSPFEEEYTRAENEARSVGPPKGLWKDKDPINPSDFRRLRRNNVKPRKKGNKKIGCRDQDDTYSTGPTDDHQNIGAKYSALSKDGDPTDDDSNDSRPLENECHIL